MSFLVALGAVFRDLPGALADAARDAAEALAGLFADETPWGDDGESPWDEAVQ